MVNSTLLESMCFKQYFFCFVFAALKLVPNPFITISIYKFDKISIVIYPLQRWTTSKQMSYEGGFQGRTNKLVDGCYSFWQGGALPLIHMILTEEGMR